jgi:fructuronate reductase
MTGEMRSEPVKTPEAERPSTSSGRKDMHAEPVAARLTPQSAADKGIPLRPRKRSGEAGIVHLGLSNFHRAHQALYTAQALDLEEGPWSIVGVARQSRDVLDAMTDQDLAYSVVSLEGNTANVQVLQAHQELLLAAADPDRVVTKLADPATQIITVTVTEAGYTFDARTGGLDLDRPELAADLTGRAPLTTVGQLAHGLRERYRAGVQPLTVMSCDNLVANGALLRSLVQQFLERTVPEAERAELLDWCDSQVAFPGSMVDRIVPRTSEQHRELVKSWTGLIDTCPVPAEPFSMWVMEDHFATARPCWDLFGAIVSDDVHGFEILKIRLLNGTHSLIAYLGMLIGARTIDEAVADPDVRSAVEAFMDEMSETLQTPTGISLEEYRASLLRRFSNSAIGHRTSQVGTDGSLKVPARIPDPVAIRAAAGHRSPMCALLAATFERVLTDPSATEPHVREGLRDPALETLTAIGSSHSRETDRVRSVLLDSGIFPAQLAKQETFIADCAELAETLRRGGVRAAIRTALEQVSSERGESRS